MAILTIIFSGPFGKFVLSLHQALVDCKFYCWKGSFIPGGRIWVSLNPKLLVPPTPLELDQEAKKEITILTEASDYHEKILLLLYNEGKWKKSGFNRNVSWCSIPSNSHWWVVTVTKFDKGWNEKMGEHFQRWDYRLPPWQKPTAAESEKNLESMTEEDDQYK